ncbi:hypothetical protein [Azomonas macrocytogenes]|uniref:Polyisoprenoid-binding protein YceI n=1 Tax=Azomonas macrocytogenes TaxID=69962 RepID=A0A839T7C8_AZOMA|nr:hypothetical protein [Azomonas macrocytogenes]MBB3104988.1 polyisoprenoid-binding protein YceI [Azomonas macrocytogenes]
MPYALFVASAAFLASIIIAPFMTDEKTASQAHATTYALQEHRSGIVFAADTAEFTHLSQETQRWTF